MKLLKLSLILISFLLLVDAKAVNNAHILVLLDVDEVQDVASLNEVQDTTKATSSQINRL
jgi:hypothetical protein